MPMTGYRPVWVGGRSIELPPVFGRLGVRERVANPPSCSVHRALALERGAGMRARNQSRAPEAHANRQPSRRSAHRGVEWAWRPVAVAGMATVGSLFVVAPALADRPSPVWPDAAAATAGPIRVVVTPASRPDPYDGNQVGNPQGDEQNSAKRASTTQSVHARLTALNAHVDTDLAAVSGVVADVTPDVLA